jgi:hypothetical protein
MESTNRVSHFISCLIKYHKVWIATLLLGILAAGIYAFIIKKDVYTARQSLIIRDDLLGSPFKPGRFESLESMKSAQETVLEVARKPEVIRNTLKILGPEASLIFGKSGGDSWPSEKAIEEIQGAISFSAPNGAEFGKTEVIVLNAKSSSRERSVKFIEILLDEIDTKLSEVRKSKLDSMVAEISQATTAANEMMVEAADRLRDMEAQLGSDISTMRNMNEPFGGTSAFDLDLNVIRADKRAVEAKLASALKQRELMNQARQNPTLDLSTSSELLTLQPGLQTMMQGLSTAQMAEAEALGKYWPAHPAVRAARETVQAARRKVFGSIGPSINGLESQIRVLQDRVNELDGLLSRKEGVLKNLTSQRVSYATLEQEVEKKREIFSQSQGRRAEMESLAKTAASADLLTRVGQPQVSTRPDGLGKRALGLAGAIGGLMMGIGLVLLMAPPFREPTGDTAAMAAPIPRETAAYAASQPVVQTEPTKQPTTQPPKQSTKTDEAAVAADSEQNKAQSNVQAPAPLNETIASRLAQYEQKQKASVAPSTTPEIVVASTTTRSTDAPAPESIMANLDSKPPEASGLTIERTKTTIKPKSAPVPEPKPTPAPKPTPSPEVTFAPAESKTPTTVPSNAPLKADSAPAKIPVTAQQPAEKQNTESDSDQATIAKLAATLGTSAAVASQINSLSNDLSEVGAPKKFEPRDSMPTIQMEAQSAIDNAGALPLRRRGTSDSHLSQAAPPANPTTGQTNSQAEIDQAFSRIQSETQSLDSNPFMNPTGKRENPFAKDRGQAVESAPAPRPTTPTTTPRAVQSNKDVQPAAPVDEQKFEQLDPSVQMPPIQATGTKALPIPAQIRELSDSILSFAQEPEEPNESK